MSFAVLVDNSIVALPEDLLRHYADLTVRLAEAQGPDGLQVKKMDLPSIRSTTWKAFTKTEADITYNANLRWCVEHRMGNQLTISEGSWGLERRGEKPIHKRTRIEDHTVALQCHAENYKTLTLQDFSDSMTALKYTAIESGRLKRLYQHAAQSRWSQATHQGRSWQAKCRPAAHSCIWTDDLYPAAYRFALKLVWTCI